MYLRLLLDFNHFIILAVYFPFTVSIPDRLVSTLQLVDKKASCLAGSVQPKDLLIVNLSFFLLLIFAGVSLIRT